MGDVGADAVRRPRSPEGHAGHARAVKAISKVLEVEAGAKSGVELRRHVPSPTSNLTHPTANDVKNRQNKKVLVPKKECGQGASTGTRHPWPGSPFGV